MDGVTAFTLGVILGALIVAAYSWPAYRALREIKHFDQRVDEARRWAEYERRDIQRCLDHVHACSRSTPGYFGTMPSSVAFGTTEDTKL